MQSPSSASSSSSAVAAPKKTFARFAREWLSSLAFALVVLIPIRSSIADWNDVPTGSMRPTILEGDRVYVNKLAFGLRVPLTQTWVARWATPERGDIVTFASPADGQRLVKRVVGLPGDHVQLVDNTVVINGAAVTRTDIGPGLPNIIKDAPPLPTYLQTENLPGHPHPITLTPNIRSRKTTEEYVVPEGHCFVLGDNRDVSGDSRFIGMVPFTSIYGRAATIVASVDPDNWYLPRWSRWLTPLK